jgi:hypothetical protein
MPLASSNDLILAGIKDILAALTNPSANSPLLPLTNSHTEAMQTISSLLTGLASKPQPEKKDVAPSNPAQATTTTVPSKPTAPTTEPTAAPSPRVETSTTQPATKPIKTALALRVEQTKRPRTAKPDAIVEPPATFDNSNGGPAGKRRRKRAAQCKAEQGKPKQGPTAPATKSKSVTSPPSSNTCKQKRSAATHRHGTRSSSHRQQAAANSTQATADAINTTFDHQKHSAAMPSILTQARLLNTPNSEDSAVDKIRLRRTQQDSGWNKHLLLHYSLPSNIKPTYVRFVAAFGTKYCGLTFTWDYNNHTIDISMPDG